MMRNQTLQYQI